MIDARSSLREIGHMPEAPQASRPLFRAQLLQQRTDHSLGEVLLARPPAAPLFAALAIAVVAGVAALLVFAEYTRTVTVAGVLRPAQGVIAITATQAGTIRRQHIAEGQIVTAGTPLFAISDRRASSGVDDASQNLAGLLQSQRHSLEAEITAAQRQIRQRDHAMGQQLEQLAAMAQQLDVQVELQAQRVTLALAAQARFAALQRAGFVAELQLQERQSDALDQQQQLAELQRSRLLLNQQRTTTESDRLVSRQQAQRELQQLQRQLDDIDRQRTEQELRRELLVTAVAEGTISAITVDDGQVVAAGRTLALLIPRRARLEAELLVPAAAAGQLRSGLPVYLRYDAYPYQQYGQFRARLYEVSRAALTADTAGADETAAAATQGTQRYFRARATLESQSLRWRGRAMPLRPGASFSASIAIETRRLYQWLLEPLYVIGKR
jgi:membrane fusion protein